MTLLVASHNTEISLRYLLNLVLGTVKLVSMRYREVQSYLSSWKTSSGTANFFNNKAFSSKKWFNENQTHSWNHIDFIFLLKILKEFWHLFSLYFSSFSGTDLSFLLVSCSFCLMLLFSKYFFVVVVPVPLSLMKRLSFEPKMYLQFLAIPLLSLEVIYAP